MEDPQKSPGASPPMTPMKTMRMWAHRFPRDEKGRMKLFHGAHTHAETPDGGRSSPVRISRWREGKGIRERGREAFPRRESWRGETLRMPKSSGVGSPAKAHPVDLRERHGSLR